MFFLLRIAFWLTVVLVLLPSGGGSHQSAQANVGATEAVAAAGAAVSDMSSFCDRQPDACVVGAQAAVTIGERAKAGAKMVYEFINERVTHGETGSVPVSKTEPKLEPKNEPKLASVRTVPSSPGSQSTLKPADLEPAWQGPASRADHVPLPRPRKDPHRKV